jgi:hypothetical protein
VTVVFVAVSSEASNVPLEDNRTSKAFTCSLFATCHWTVAFNDDTDVSCAL